jgi:HTH-type transcriptional regulator / antitoxin HigA
MTATLDSITYGRLLAQFQPQPLETSEDYRLARLTILNLLKQGQLSPEEKALIKLMKLLMREYDLHQPQAPSVKPNDILEHLIESNRIDSQDLAIKLGGEDVLSQIIDGSRDISPQQAQVLAELFKVSSNLFRVS